MRKDEEEAKGHGGYERWEKIRVKGGAKGNEGSQGCEEDRGKSLKHIFFWVSWYLVSYMLV